MEQQLLDELGRPLSLARQPSRIVSLVPSLTEWLFAIRLGSRVVGITEYCTRTGGAPHPARVGGTKNPDRSAIEALKPDLVIASREENRERDVAALERAGLAVYVSDPRSLGDAIGTLGRLARILGAESAAAPHLRDMVQARALAESGLPAQSRRVLALIWRRPWMAIGADTYADDILRLAGGYNVARALSGHYPRLEDQDFGSLEPDLVLLPTEPYSFTDNDLPALRAVYGGTVCFVDGELLTWYGPRIPLALGELKAALGLGESGVTRGYMPVGPGDTCPRTRA